jgi:hypothetical protein
MDIDFFDLITIEINESYIFKFVDIAMDLIDCPNNIEYAYKDQTFLGDCVLDIDLKKDKIVLNKKSKTKKNIINRNKILVSHDFLKAPLLVLYLLFSSHKSFLQMLLENFYDYMHHAILSSITEIRTTDQKIVSSFDPIYLKQYNHLLEGIVNI